MSRTAFGKTINSMEELTILQHDEDFNQATTFEKAQSMLLHAFNQADDE